MKVHGFIPGTLPDCLPAAAGLLGLPYANSSVRGAVGSTKKLSQTKTFRLVGASSALALIVTAACFAQVRLPFGGVVVTRAASPDRARR
jgi:hypothetical protein